MYQLYKFTYCCMLHARTVQFSIADCHMYSRTVCTFLCSSTTHFQLRMNVSTVSITLVVALIGICMLNAYSERIDLDSFKVGNCAAVHYTAPSTGRQSINLYKENGDILLHVDYRVNWSSNTNTIVLNTRTGRKWGTEQLVTGIASTPGTVLEFLICAEANDFSITFNKKQVATYQYRINATVTRVEYANQGYGTTLEELRVVYS